MTPQQHVQLHQLRHAILGARDRGRVVVEFMEGPGGSVDANSAGHLADALLALCNLPVLGPHWRQVNRPRAGEVLMMILHEDLERESPSAPLTVARKLVDRLMEQFPPDAIFLTNVKPTADLAQSPRTWASGRADIELDAGVAIVSADLAGLVWVEDRA
jgi:hypothetical protein